MARASSRTSTAQEKLFSGPRFERDFFLRTFGDLVRVPDVALTELVANAWDAGAANVEVRIPELHGEELSVEDDGCGLTASEFDERWMTLAYNRQEHQGPDVVFPPERGGERRRAFGRNGQGRHGLLCFGDRYVVQTWKDGTELTIDLRTSQGREPFERKILRERARSGHGTRLSVVVDRKLPDADRIREVLSGRFLHDPQFALSVNGLRLPFEDLPGLTAQRDLLVVNPENASQTARLKVSVIEGEAGRTKHQSGVAFWVGGRLVGAPGWIVGGRTVLDGRTRTARRLTVLIRSDDLFDEVLPDWSGFKNTQFASAVSKAVADTVEDVLRAVLASRIKETAGEALIGRESRLSTLSVGQRLEVAEVAQAMMEKNPLLPPSAVAAAIDGVLQVKEQTAPQALIAKIMKLPAEDIEGLSRLLAEWTVRDALFILDEIGRRMKIVEALSKLVGDKSVDEVQVVHPLISQARWIFGADYESAEYASNISLKNAIAKVFGEDIKKEAFDNWRKRPDLLWLSESTLSAVGLDEIEIDSGLPRLKKVLLLELKRGGFKIGRADMNQAQGYVQDIFQSGMLETVPFIHAFVVGHEIEPRTTRVVRVGDPEFGRVEAVTYAQLIRGAQVRLFHLHEQVENRYPESGLGLLERLSKGEPSQLELLTGAHKDSDS